MTTSKIAEREKRRFLGFKSGKTQSGRNNFANFILKKKSVYFPVYHLLFLKQLSQSYHCPKKAFLGLFSSFSVTTMFHLFHWCDCGVILISNQSIIILQFKLDAAMILFLEKKHFLVKFDYLKNSRKGKKALFGLQIREDSIWPK